MPINAIAFAAFNLGSCYCLQFHWVISKGADHSSWRCWDCWIGRVANSGEVLAVAAGIDGRFGFGFEDTESEEEVSTG